MTTTAAARSADRRSDRLASVAFWVAVVAAVPLILHLSRSQWFLVDDWHFLRTLDSLTVENVFEPYWGHWTTLPRLWEASLFSAFGLHHYRPYQLGVIGAHVVVVVLVRAVMLRAGAEAWTASALAVFLLVFGPGAENIVWGFQISMTGSLAFGLASLLLADHDGGRRWRDAAAVLCGVASVASTNVGLITAGALGVSVLLRRGWRSAALVVGPIGAAYVTWWLLAARGVPDPAQRTAGSVGSFLKTAGLLLGELATDSGPGPAGLVVVVAVVAGAWSLVLGLRSGDRARLAVPAGMAVAAVLLVLSVGYTRGGRLEHTSQDPTPTRYLHLLVAFVLPLAALSVSAVARRSPWARVAVVVTVLACLPANISLLEVRPLDDRIDFIATSAEVVASYERVHASADLATISPGWLRRMHREGRIMAPRPGAEHLRDLAFARQVVVAADLEEDPDGCRPIAPGDVRLDPADWLIVDGPPGATAVVTDVERDLRAELRVGESGRASALVLVGPVPARIEVSGDDVTVLHCVAG